MEHGAHALLARQLLARARQLIQVDQPIALGLGKAHLRRKRPIRDTRIGACRELLAHDAKKRALRQAASVVAACAGALLAARGCAIVRQRTEEDGGQCAAALLVPPTFASISKRCRSSSAVGKPDGTCSGCAAMQCWHHCGSLPAAPIPVGTGQGRSRATLRRNPTHRTAQRNNRPWWPRLQCAGAAALGRALRAAQARSALMQTACLFRHRPSACHASWPC